MKKEDEVKEEGRMWRWMRVRPACGRREGGASRVEVKEAKGEEIEDGEWR